MAGRPSTYNQPVVDEICERLACGESLRSIVKDDGMPSIATFYKWLRENDELLKQYARAKDDGADSYADKIAEVADGALSGEYDPQAARVAIDGYKWTAAKLKPRKYGDKQSVDHTSSDGSMTPQVVERVIIDPKDTD